MYVDGFFFTHAMNFVELSEICKLCCELVRPLKLNNIAARVLLESLSPMQPYIFLCM